MTHAESHADPFGVAPGRAVYTADGDHLGTVKEVSAGYFKVQASMRPDYWLQSQFVSSAATDRITMDFAKEALDDYKLDGPPVTGAADPDAVAGMTHDPSMPANAAAATIQAAAHQHERG